MLCVYIPFGCKIAMGKTLLIFPNLTFKMVLLENSGIVFIQQHSSKVGNAIQMQCEILINEKFSSTTLLLTSPKLESRSCPFVSHASKNTSH